MSPSSEIWKKKDAYARLLGLSTSLTILSVKLISILIVLCAKLVQESSAPRFTSLTVSPEQKISSEDKVNYGLFGDNHLCSVSDLNHSQCHWQQNKQNKLRNWFLWVGCNNNCRREVWKDLCSWSTQFTPGLLVPWLNIFNIFLGWETDLKIPHLPSKLCFSAKDLLLRQYLNNAHYQATYQLPEDG